MSVDGAQSHDSNSSREHDRRCSTNSTLERSAFDRLMQNMTLGAETSSRAPESNRHAYEVNKSADIDEKRRFNQLAERRSWESIDPDIQFRRDIHQRALPLPLSMINQEQEKTVVAIGGQESYQIDARSLNSGIKQ